LYFMLPHGAGSTRSVELMGGVQGWAAMCPADDDTSGQASWRLHVANKIKICADRAAAAEVGEADAAPRPNPYEDQMSLENVTKACAHLPVARLVDEDAEAPGSSHGMNNN